MEILTVLSFLDYYEKIRQRTLHVVRCVPSDKIEWTPAAGKFSIGDRGQVYLYLAMLNVATPPLFGLTSEEVRSRSIG